MARRGRAAAFVCALASLAIVGTGCGDDLLIDWPVDGRDGRPLLDRIRPMELAGEIPGVEKEPPLDPSAPPPRFGLVAHGATACSGDDVRLGTLAIGAVEPIVWSWEPADGLSDPTVRDPVATGDETRTYTVTATDSTGAVATATVVVERRALPVARILIGGGDDVACAGETLRLEAERPPAGSASLRYAWDLDGDATTVETTSPATDFRPAADAIVSLTVTDADSGCSATDTASILLRALPEPVVAFTAGSERICAGEAVGFDASASRDADGNPVASWAWDLDGDAATVESTTAQVTPYVATGAPARLRVTDAWGCTAWATQQVEVGALPVARIDFAEGASLVCAGDRVVLDGAASTVVGGVASHAWDLDGDWSTVEATGSQAPALIPAGPQAVALRVTDGWGCVGETAVQLDARPLPVAAIAFAQGRADACEGDAVALTGAGSIDANGAPVAAHAWDLDGDGAADQSGPETAPFVPVAGQQVRLTVRDGLGCTASAVQALDPRQLPTPVIEIAEGAARICSGDPVGLRGTGSVDADGNPVATYAWNLDGDPSTIESTAGATGSFLPVGGAASLTVTDGAGCSATVQQLFDVGALPTPRIAFLAGDDLVCAGEEVRLDGSGSTAAPGSTLANWSWDLDGDGGFETSGATPPAFAPSGAYAVRLRVEDARGCSAEATQALAARPLPVASIAFAGGADSVCAGESVALDGGSSTDADGNLPASFAWDLDGDGAADVTAAATGAFVPSGTQTARLVVTDALGCVGAATQALEARALPTATIRFLEGNALVCSGERVQLDGSLSRAANGDPIAGFAWDLDGDGADDANAATPAAFAPAAGATARLVVTDATGCTAAASQPVDVRALPTPRISITEGAQAICDGAALGFSGAGSTDADGAAVASWSWDLDGDGTADRTGVTTGSIRPGAGGSAVLTVTDGHGCSASTAQPFTVLPLPVADAGADARFCAGGSLVLGAPAQPGVRYAWSPAAGLDDAGIAQPLATPAGPTLYTLTATDANGCTATDTVQVEVHPMPVADAGPDRQVARGGQVRLLGAASGGAPAWAFAWSPASSLDDAAAQQPFASPRSDAVYTLSVTDANGCSDTDDVAVQVRDGIAVAASADMWRCLDSGEPVTISASATGGVEPVTLQWIADPPCASCIASPNAASTEVRPDVTTTFTITATDANGTVATDQVTITVLPSIAASGIAGPDKYIQRGDSVQIGSAAIPGVSYRWTCDNWSCAISDHNIADPWVAPSGNTLYRVEISDGNTCRGTDEVQIFMDVRVIATVPTEAHDRWPRDALIWVIFDTDMDPASFAGNVTLWNPANGQILAANTSYDAASRTLEVDPIAYPQNNRPAVLQIRGGPGGVQSLAGDIMYSDFLLEYNASSMGDGRAPAAAWTHPVAGATGVIRTVDVVVKFDETVDPGSVNGSTFFIAGVPATVSYDPRNLTALLRPTQPLAPNTLYTVRVNGVRDGPNNVANFSFSFTTGSPDDTVPPAVVASTPQAGVLSYDVGTPFSVSFSEPIDATSIGGFRLIDVATGLPVAGEIIYDPQTRTATLDPGRMLVPNHDYRLVVSGVLDHAGNPMAAPYVAPFRTTGVVFLERFETGAAGWTLAAPWATDFQGTRSGAFGLVDSPAGNYAPGISIAATTPAMNVAGRGTVALSFWNRRLLATDQDRLVVEASTNGTSWTEVGRLQGPSGWQQWNGNITTGGAGQLRVRLRLETNASVQMDGVFVDELVVR